jgi:hypothetical protein
MMSTAVAYMATGDETHLERRTIERRALRRDDVAIAVEYCTRSAPTRPRRRPDPSFPATNSSGG